nr:DUF1838 family protein [Sphingomonas populi]
MTGFDITRRSILSNAPLVAAGLGGLSASTGALATARSGKSISDARANELLGDPVTRARVRARVMGSCGTETVYFFYRLSIYGYSEDDNLVPFFTMNHLSVSEWRPVADDKYQSKVFECGAYCAFDTDEPLEEWKNPFTGETRKVWHFLGGPFTVTVGADGVEARGAELNPRPLRMEAFGGKVFTNTTASMKMPNPIKPAEYPKLSSGPVSYWDTISTMASPIDQAFDDTITSADSFSQFQNMGSWHPWMGMGARPGRNYGRAVGAKVRSLDGIPPAALKSMQTHTPRIFDRANWTAPYFDVPEYMKSLKTDGKR